MNNPSGSQRSKKLKEPDVTIAAQVLQRAASQKLNLKYLTPSKTAVQPLKATPASQRPRTEYGQDMDTTHRPAYLTNKLMKHAGQHKNRYGTHDTTRHNKDDTNVNAWMAPAVATN